MMTTVRAGTPEFEELVERVAAAVQAGERPCIVFEGGEAADRQTALAAFAEKTSMDVYQRDTSGLIGTRPRQTQGNLREAFDGTTDVPTLLVFEKADALFEAGKQQQEDDELDEDAHTPVHYFFERIGRKPGITILFLSDPRHVESASGEGVFAVVKL